MSRRKSKVVNYSNLFPRHALRALLDAVDIPREPNGAPAYGTDELARAHATLTGALKVWEDLDLASNGSNEALSEIDVDHLLIGVCPTCDHNDGVVVVNDAYWAVCHQHAVRWRAVPPELEAPEFVRQMAVTARMPSVLNYQEVEFRYPIFMRPNLVERIWRKLEPARVWVSVWLFDMPVWFVRRVFARA